ncbi:MAG: hypothetical protein IJU76_10085 [Desulfovibrionaceae bacterium]|nr:hypothetical protein [Desulfovibrionaceae bacterium]
MAIAHKIAKMVHYDLSHQQPYKDPQIDYQQISCIRNKARWFRKLLSLKNLDITVTDKETGVVTTSTSYQLEQQANR